MVRTGDAETCREIDELASNMESLNMADMNDLLQKFACMAVGKVKQD